MNDRSGEVFRIGDWQVDPAIDEISRAGNVHKLEPRAMRVLVCLAERAGEVISVEQLLDAVWKDVIVTDNSLAQCIKEVRQALGDDAQAIVKTVAKRG